MVPKSLVYALKSRVLYAIAVLAGAFPAFDRSNQEKAPMTIAEFFDQMPNVLNSAAAAGMNKTFQWNITGDEAGVWAFKILNGQGEVIPGGVEKPDITFTVSDEDWLAITEGKLDAMNAFTTGKLKVAGDMNLVMKLQNLFPTRR